MKYINKIANKKKCTDGMSPANVYKCTIGEDVYYLKTIDKKFSQTTYSVKREAEMMKWLQGKLKCPCVLEYGEQDTIEYLLMGELKGWHIDEFANQPLQYISYLAKAIKQLWSVDINDCNFDSRIDFRLAELRYLLDNNLADVDLSNWQQTIGFTEPEELYKWLCDNKPLEELVFSHGDIGANFFVADDEIYFYDLARCGVADKWLDIAFCVRDIREYYSDTEYENKFFELLGIEPDYEKINYYILLDNMF